MELNGNHHISTTSFQAEERLTPTKQTKYEAGGPQNRSEYLEKEIILFLWQERNHISSVVHP
jgi:hypothetical protein